MTRALVVAVGLSVLAIACESGARTEAAQLVSAVERFRRADNAAKPAMADALRGVRCTDAEVCRARDACLASADPTAKGLLLKAEVEQGIAALGRGELAKESPEAQALPRKIDEAQALLKEGNEHLPACDDRTMALKRKYRL